MDTTPHPLGDTPPPGETSATTPHSATSRADTSRRIDDVLLRGPALYNEETLCEVTGATSAQVNSYWQALGLPVTNRSAVIFTEDDADALRSILVLAEAEQFDHRTLTSLIRSVGHTADRLALWQAEALVEHMAHNFDLDDLSARQEVLKKLPDMIPVLEEQVLHAWRRQFAALAGRWSVEFSTQRPDQGSGGGVLPLPRAVGFADIVSFTSQTAKMRSSELSNFVSNFEASARDVITRAGGRVVKTIGDAVLYIADDVVTGANVALGLAQAGQSSDDADADVPPVRVSLVWGRVLSRFGDVFGPSVNLAARLTDEAEPGEVLLDPHTAALLAGDHRFALTGTEARDLQGVGSVAPVRLQWAYSPTPLPSMPGSGVIK
ncbi:adenylate/guanylate cyclase domain-containing protein [Jonesia quinghaiensis]|uniref:adenylate/guanylate cyclase domain-containing protein n=1 Tax=Jonesia quinghaiensis TaxID=262806 RepID=UPI0003F57780|nr:adenylate/guanylate cyclase domain-containing protein [Jonesia quinghaiensis]